MNKSNRGFPILRQIDILPFPLESHPINRPPEGQHIEDIQCGPCVSCQTPSFRFPDFIMQLTSCQGLKLYLLCVTITRFMSRTLTQYGMPTHWWTWIPLTSLVNRWKDCRFGSRHKWWSRFDRQLLYLTFIFKNLIVSNVNSLNSAAMIIKHQVASIRMWSETYLHK